MTNTGLDNYQSLFGNSPNPYIFFDQYQLNETVNDINPFSILNENLSINPNESISINPNEDMNYKSLYFLEKQTTKWKTKDNNIFYPKKEINNIDESGFNCVFLEEIIENFKKNKNLSGIWEKLVKNKKIEDAEKKLCKIKRKRDNEYENSDENNELRALIKKENEAEEKVKRGRKIEIINKKRIEHNKYSEDNIIKKIKSKLLLYPLQFLNNLLESNNNSQKTYRLYKLNYKYIKRLKKEIDLNIFKMSLKDLYSLEITPTYKNISKHHNKNVINDIIKNKELDNYQAIIFAFNLTFGEWMELFTYKKNIYQIINDYNYEGLKNVIEEIETQMVRVEDLLENILEKNDKHFFSIFTFFLYNYQEWFLIKRERNKKQTKFNSNT